VRPLHLEVTIEAEPTASNLAIPLASFIGHRQTGVYLEYLRGEGYRLLLRGDDGPNPSPFHRIPVGGTFPVDVETGGDLVNVVTGVEGARFEVEKQTYDSDWRWLPQVFQPLEVDEERAREMGVSIEVLDSPRIPVCDRLAERARG